MCVLSSVASLFSCSPCLPGGLPFSVFWFGSFLNRQSPLFLSFSSS